MAKDLKDELRHKAFTNLRDNLTRLYERGGAASCKKRLAQALDLNVDTVSRWSAYPDAQKAADAAKQNTQAYQWKKQYRQVSGAEVLPDIGYLPVISKELGVSVDYLLSSHLPEEPDLGLGGTYGEAACLVGYMLWNGLIELDGVQDPVLRRLGEMYCEKRADKDVSEDDLLNWLLDVRIRFSMPLPGVNMDYALLYERLRIEDNTVSSDEMTQLYNIAVMAGSMG